MSSANFLMALQNEHSDIAKKLIKQFDKRPLDWQILQYQYLPIISKLTRLKFELYQIIPKSEGQPQSVKLLSTNPHILLDDPLAIICLGVNEDYQNNEIPQLIFIRDDNPTLNELYKNLESVKDDCRLTADIYLKIANHYMTQAKKMKKSARQLTQFNEAQQFYERSLRLFPTSDACWMISETFLACGQNIKALRFLNRRDQSTSSNLDLSSQSQFYYYRARTRLNLQHYVIALININKALKREPNNDKYKRERSKIDKLYNYSKNRSSVYSDKINVNCNDQIYNRRHSSSSINPCNILSIDGGGVRGIIPAVVLCELERDTKKPISHSFNLLAGTSTGGIITLGLSIPQIGSNKPKYHASDILSLYTEHSTDIFPETWIIDNLFAITSYRYSSDPLTKLLKRYYGDTQLSRLLLTDVAIPACNLSESCVTTYFTRYNAIHDTSKNFSVLDVALATSATPTYFPTHKIVVGSIQDCIVKEFADGRIQANNPASYAYNHAIDINNNLHLLSLGTGDCIKNSMKPSNNRNILFWVSKASYLLAAQQNNVDDELNTLMGSRYHRWQYWLEDPIRLDDVSPATIDYLVNIGYGLVEDLRADDDNSWNKLVEHLNYS